uniref:Uncharacterized protein n=1 Tax=Panagrolaimus sp. JU765 TaxID=591449 RepID=A0AC34Q2T9_9BILA
MFLHSDTRGCAYDDKPFAMDNMRIICKSPQCNDYEKHGTSDGVFSCEISDPGTFHACNDELCYIKTAEFS